MNDDKGEGFKDKTMDQKLSIVPTPVELAARRNQQVAIAGQANLAGTNQTQSNPEKWDRERCLASMIQVAVATGVSDVNKIVSGAKVLYDYIVEGKTPPEDAPKGTSFHAKGGPHIP